MDRIYALLNSIVDVPYAGDWVAGTEYKKGAFVTIGGLLFMANIAHVATSDNQPYADPAVIYARQYRGTYSAATTYAKYDSVTSAEGNQYLSLVEGNLAHTPPIDGTDSAYWACYARRGPQGIKGDPGVGAANQTVEVPSGTMDGSNQTFALSHTPAGNIQLFYSGIMLREGAEHDFTISGTTITLLGSIKPVLGENLMAVYLH
jgi:hypothetical protein